MTQESSPRPVESDTTRKGRKWWLALVVLAATLLVAEAAATWKLGERFERGRFVGNNWRAVGTKDPHLGWANRAGASGKIFGGVEGFDGIFEYTAEINALGFRDPERTWSKPEGKLRVLVLGDSVAWGWGVDNGQRFSDLLEERWGDRVEFLNLAVPGYGTDQQLWTLEQNGLRFDPDLVLLCFIINDVFEAQNIESYGMAKPRFERSDEGTWSVVRPPALDAVGGLQDRAKRWWRIAQARSALLTWATLPDLRWAGDDFFANLQFAPAGPEELQFVQQTVEQISDPDSPTYHAFDRIQVLCSERRIPFLAFSVAHGHDRFLYEPAYPQPDPKPGPGFRSSLARHLYRAGESIGFETWCLDGAMALRVQAGERLHCGDGHPNARGHEVIAESLAPWVGASLRLDPVRD